MVLANPTSVPPALSDASDNNRGVLQVPLFP